MAAGPDVVLLPKVCDPAQVVRLEREVERLEAANGMVVGITELVPNMQLDRGLIQTFQICQVSKRISGALLESEDIAENLGAERRQDGLELAYVRQRLSRNVRPLACWPSIVRTHGLMFQVRKKIRSSRGDWATRLRAL